MPWRYKENAPELLDQLAAIVARDGATRFLRAPLVAAHPACFPEPWEPTLLAVARVTHRLLFLSGLGDRELEIEDRRPRGKTPSGLGAAAVMTRAGPAEPRLVFAVYRCDSFRAVAGTAACEVAQSFVELTDLEPHSSSIDANAPLTAAAVFLGLGALCAIPAASGREEDSTPPLDDLGFLYAVQLALRGVDSPTAASLLEPAGDEAIRSVCGWLDLCAGAEIDLRDRLGLQWEEPSSHPDPDAVLGRMPALPTLPPVLANFLIGAEASYREALEGFDLMP